MSGPALKHGLCYSHSVRCNLAGSVAWRSEVAGMILDAAAFEAVRSSAASCAPCPVADGVACQNPSFAA